MSLPDRLRELVLWAGAALGLLAVAAGLAVALGGYGFLVFRSGSMSPEIPTGGIALSRTVEAADIKVGDVVSVTAANGERITHRVVSTTLRGDEASLVLQGDANATPDSEVYAVTSVERVVASAPYAGYVVAHALTPPGLLALASFSLMLIALTGGRREDEDDEDRAPRSPRSRPRHRGQASTRRRAVAGGALLAVVAGSGATVAHTTGTWAAFTDKPSASTGLFTAATVAPPATLTCDAAADTLRWTPPSSGAPTGYRLYWSYNANSGSILFDGTTLSGRPPAPGLFGNRQYTVTVTAHYGSWESVPSPSDSIRGQNVVFGTSWSC